MDDEHRAHQQQQRFLQLINPDDRLPHDIGGRGAHSQNSPFLKQVLEHRDFLHHTFQYNTLSTIEKRRVRRMLLDYIKSHGGRVLQVDAPTGWYYELTDEEALGVMAAKLREPRPYLPPTFTDQTDPNIFDHGTEHVHTDNVDGTVPNNTTPQGGCRTIGTETYNSNTLYREPLQQGRIDINHNDDTMSDLELLDSFVIFGDAIWHEPSSNMIRESLSYLQLGQEE
jgi:hypothetical protein